MNNDQITQEKQLFITFGTCKLTKIKQYKSRLRRKLTQNLIFPKCSYAIEICIYIYGILKKKNIMKSANRTRSLRQRL